MAFARRQFELSAPQEDGKPLIEHLRAVERQTGRVHSMILTAPDLPEGLQSLWAHFLALHESRGSTGWGPARISFADIDAFQRVTMTPLSPWEVGCIRSLDSMWVGEFAPKPKADKK